MNGMDSIFYQNTTYWVLFVDIVVALAAFWLFKTGRATKRTLWTVGLVFATAIVFMHWLFGGQHLLPPNLSGNIFFAIILIGAGWVVLLLELTSSKVMKNLSQEHLQVAQGIRVLVGGGFLMEGVLNVIPGWFGILDGFLHIASGFLALLAAIAYLKKWEGNRAFLWIANIVGLADILIIVTGICFWVWSDLGPFHNMNYVVFGGGPIFLWLHYNSIKKLLHQ